MQNNNNKKKTYLPSWILQDIESWQGTRDALNQALYLKYPHVSKRSIRRYTQAYFNDNYITQLVKPSYTVDGFLRKTIVPKSYEQSGWEEYINRVKSLLRKDRIVRLANIQDVHIETADPALLQLVGDLIAFWQPDVVPVMCDIVDNLLFSKWRHGGSYHINFELVDIDSDLQDYGSDAIAYPMFLRLTMHYIDFVQAANQNVDAIYPVVLGNHEAWALQHIYENPQIAALFFSDFFKQLEKRSVLWARSSSIRELPLTDNVLLLHGWSTRQDNNAKVYLKHYEGMSVVAGHSHRADVAYSRPYFNTGGRNFAAITGTLGTLTPQYRHGGYVNHDRAVQFIEVAPRGNIGHVVHTIYIHHVANYYEARFLGKTFRVQTSKVAEMNPFCSI